MHTSNKKYQPFLDSLDRLGFCTLRVFDDTPIQQLRDLYSEHFEQQPINEMYASHNSNPAEKGIAISNAIQTIVGDKLQTLLPDYNYFIGHFMVKGAHVDKEFSLHQDWNIVDETKHKSYQIWIPLQLTTTVNGGMFVVPGSHKFFNNFRSGSYSIPVVPYCNEIKAICTDINVPAGNILIYHNGLFHASHPNNTDEIRIAVIVNFVEKNAPTYFFQKNAEQKTTDLYPITGEVLLSHLPLLEKGIVPLTIEKTGITHLSPTDNNTITGKTLRKHYQMAFWGCRAVHVKQLHIATNRFFENELNREGYTIVDLLSTSELKLFQDHYAQHFGGIDKLPGKFTTLQHTDSSTKLTIHQFISANVQPALNRYFSNYNIPVSQYYTKKALTSGDIDLHADSTLLLNHQLEPHYAIWVPLVDVNEQNGCLTVIPKSHSMQQTIYGGSFSGCHEKHREWLRQFEVPVRLKAGQAIVFDNNLLHNSTANLTLNDRICFTFRMIHTSSDLYSFICEDKEINSLSVYLENENYYMDEHWNGEGLYRGGKFIGSMKNGIVSLSIEDYIDAGINEL